MKIRTLDELQDAIDSEMAWRKRELFAIKANIQSARKFAKDTALRAGITLLYAHWEGAVKNIAQYYLTYVSFLRLPYDALKPNFLAISVKSELSTYESTGKASHQTRIVNAIFQKHKEQSRIPMDGIIRTNSNLSSSAFIEIMSAIGLCCSSYEPHYKLIDEVLLNMRNRIAHGEQLGNVLSLDESRYIEIHDQIRDLIEQFSIQVSNAAFAEEYKMATPKQL